MQAKQGWRKEDIRSYLTDLSVTAIQAGPSAVACRAGLSAMASQAGDQRSILMNIFSKKIVFTMNGLIEAP
ncbi:MAG: hypothetical protein HKN76_12330 [Saprospiraceae bacterium]|nr:hypothetical protein [Saprospiraceae bacterium]